MNDQKPTLFNGVPCSAKCGKLLPIISQMSSSREQLQDILNKPDVDSWDFLIREARDFVSAEILDHFAEEATRKLQG